MDKPEFPEKIRIVIEPAMSTVLSRDIFKWHIQGLRERTLNSDGEYEEWWIDYGRRWAYSLHDSVYEHKGHARKYEKALAQAQANAEKICQQQCVQLVEYEKWQAGYVTIEVDCGDC